MLTTSDKLRRLGVALFVLACIGGIAWAISSTREVDANGDVVADADDPCDVQFSGDVDSLPTCDPAATPIDEIVEAMSPADGAATVPQQVQVSIDLGPLYTGTLVVRDIEVPEDQLVRRPELNQVFFSPGDGQVIEEWAPGRNCVRAIVWPVQEGRDGDSTRTVEWCFEVS